MNKILKNITVIVFVCVLLVLTLFNNSPIFKKRVNTLAAEVNYNIFLKKEVKDIAIVDDSLFETIEFNERNVKEFNNLILELQETYKSHIQHTIIVPDKSFYLDNSYVHLDNSIYDNLLFDFIDVSSEINENDFYKTDLHITNEGSYKIYSYICSIFDLKKYNVDFVNGIDDFFGYYSRKALYYKKSDIINRPTNSVLDNLIVKNMEDDGEFHKYYGCYFKNQEEDKYSFNLDGNKAITIIENNLCSNNKELVIFKDSYGLSIAPYLAQNYKKVTLLDLRLINKNLVQEYISEDSEILYYYGYKSINL